MPSEMKVNKISPASGTAITLGDSGDTFTIPSGATITNNGTQNGFGSTSASDLSSGTLPMARLSGTLPALNGSALTALNATQLTSGTIPIARIADDAITLAKMAPGTDGQIITYDASGNPVAVGPGTDGQVLTSTGAGSPPAFEAVSAGPTLGTMQTTTSAGSKTFSGIPAGTKNVIISWDEISTAAVTSMQVQLGDSGGIESSGYTSTSVDISSSTSIASESSTTGHIVSIQGSGRLLSGHMHLTLINPSTHFWISSHTAKLANDRMVAGGGTKTINTDLTTIYLVLGNNSYDAGQINIMYW